MLFIAIVPLMDTESAMLNALNIGADDGRKTAHGTEKGKTMDFYELERANEIRDEIRELDTLVRCLKHSIEKHEINSREPRYKRIFRFLNCKTRENGEEKARIFLFSGLTMHGVEIPVDQEICGKVLELFQHRLEEKYKEFAMIGGGAWMDGDGDV